MHIVSDENIPLAEEAFGGLGTVHLMPGRAITAADVEEADALLVRSVTSVGPALLKGSRVRFVGSATAGADHVSRGYLARAGIAFIHAPGANASSVGDYVVAALAAMARRDAGATSLRGKVVGIIGCGNVGARLARRLPALGMRVLKNDPPRAEREGADGFLPIETVLAEADVLTLHVPLERDGAHPTHHLIGADELEAVKPDAWLVNTARGAVVDSAALEAALIQGQIAAAVLDVWEGEPMPTPPLVRSAALATPHIAGYAYDGKVRGTAMLYDGLTWHFGIPRTWDAEAVLAPAPREDFTLNAPDPSFGEAAYLYTLTQQMYDVEADDARLRETLDVPPAERATRFGLLRKHYPRRRAFARYTLPASDVPAAYRRAVEEGLQVRLTD